MNDQVCITQSIFKDTERYLFVLTYAETKAVDWFMVEVLPKSFTVNSDNPGWKQAA